MNNFNETVDSIKINIKKREIDIYSSLNEEIVIIYEYRYLYKDGDFYKLEEFRRQTHENLADIEYLKKIFDLSLFMLEIMIEFKNEDSYYILFEDGELIKSNIDKNLALEIYQKIVKLIEKKYNEKENKKPLEIITLAFVKCKNDFEHKNNEKEMKDFLCKWGEDYEHISDYIKEYPSSRNVGDPLDAIMKYYSYYGKEKDNVIIECVKYIIDNN